MVYLTPGVYTEEFETGAKPIEGVSPSITAIIGETERGDTQPQLLTSWDDYRNKFGGFFGRQEYVPYAVQGFFQNGGQLCYVSRIVPRDGGGEPDSASEALGDWKVTAVGPGEWGNRVFVIAREGRVRGVQIDVYHWREDPGEPLFDPEVRANEDKPQPHIRETFEDLDADESSINFYEKRINGNSRFIEIEPDPPAGAPPAAIAPGDVAALGGGVDTGANLVVADFDGEGEPGARQGLAALDEPDFRDVAIVYAPNSDEVAGLQARLANYCEDSKYRFAILDSPARKSDIGTLTPRADVDSKYAAYYYPWIKVTSAETGALNLVPPGGHIAGIYARSDTQRGVFKAPANETINGAVELEFRLTDADQGRLNPIGVNVLRAFPGRGRRVWGARTLSSDPAWKYVNVRRFFNFVEASIDRSTQWVVFEPNNEQLWARVVQTIKQFLRTQWRAGALMGRKEEQAFYVRADRSTMTQNEIDNGRLIVEIGLAATKPAEFVIFRFTQFTAGSQAA